MSRLQYQYTLHANSSAIKVAQMVGSDLRVLELGCGPGMITQLLASRRCKVTAIERDVDASQAAKPYCEIVHILDLNDPGWAKELANIEKFDVVVAGDVLEHLLDPWAVLLQCRALLADDGAIILSLPHVGHNAIIASLFASDFSYQPWGLLDSTHLRFFGIHNVKDLVKLADLKITQADFVIKSPEETEFAKRWRELPAVLRQALSSNSFGSVYQIIVKAVPVDSTEKEINLLDLEFNNHATESKFTSKIRNYVLSYVSLHTRQRIRRIIDYVNLKRYN